MNRTDVNAPCPRGCPWPARECLHESGYTGPLLAIAGLSILGYVALGAGVVILTRVAWHAARAIVG